MLTIPSDPSSIILIIVNKSGPSGYISVEPAGLPTEFLWHSHYNHNKMKTLLVFAACVLLAQALTDEQKEKLKKHRSECLSETKVEEQLVNKLKSGDYKADNEQLKKYALCMMIKSELMTKDGKFKKDVALAKVPNAADKAAVEKLIDTCLANKGNTPHQTAWNYVKCYHEKDPRHAIFL